MSMPDVIVFVLYMVSVRVAGLLAGKVRKNDSEDYFLGGRRLGWITVAGSLFGTNISSAHFIALASDGYRTGMANAAYEIVGLVGLIALVHIFGPRYLKQKLMTLPELLKVRFGPLSQMYLTIYALLLYALMLIPGSLFTGAIALRAAFGGSMWLSGALGSHAFAYVGHRTAGQ